MFDRRESQPLHPGAHESLRRGEGLLETAFASQPPMQVAPHATIIGSHQPRQEILRLRSGWACRSRTLADGRRSILAIYLPGDIIGLGAVFGGGSADSVTALTPVTCQAIAAARLVDLLDEPEVALRVWHVRERELRRVEALATGLARGSAEERISALLVNLYDRLQRRQLVTGSSFRLPMTQREIGDHLGLTVVHVNRVLRRLREQRVVRIHNRTAVIDDLALLMRAAGAASRSAGPRAPFDGGRAKEGARPALRSRPSRPSALPASRPH